MGSDASLEGRTRIIDVSVVYKSKLIKAVRPNTQGLKVMDRTVSNV
jgi:hypothetical protein